jgi:hypothetical protein
VTDRAERASGAYRVFAWISVACITVSLLVMIGVSIAGPSIVVPAMAHTPGTPPWWVSLGLPSWILFVMWGDAAVAAIGVGAGLIAVARGARPRIRPLLAASFIVVAALVVLPPAGSTDAQSYAIDGNMLVVGHSPYVDTPLQMARLGDKMDINSPATWRSALSDYGPVATAEEWVSAEFGGWSMAQVTFWLKLWAGLAFAAVTLLLDRVTRADRAMRLRAHLLWSLNPLVLWEIVASGHVDVLAVAFGLGGLLLLRMKDERPSLLKCAGAGALIGLAIAVKSPFLLFGLGAAWALRRSLAGLAALAAGGAAVLVPSYAAFGTAAVKVLFERGNQVTWDNLYQVFFRPFGVVNFGAGSTPPLLMPIALVLFVAVALLAFNRMPDLVPGLPAVTPALALSISWIFLWPFQRPWYDVMIIALLALYPASRLDWVVLARLCFGAITYMEATKPAGSSVLQDVQLFQGDWITSVVRLLSAVAFVWLCLTGRWGFRPQAESGAQQPVDNPPFPVDQPVEDSADNPVDNSVA